MKSEDEIIKNRMKSEDEITKKRMKSEDHKFPPDENKHSSGGFLNKNEQ